MSRDSERCTDRENETDGENSTDGKSDRPGSPGNYERASPFAGTGVEGNNGDVAAPDLLAARDRVLSALLTFRAELQRAGVEVPANASVDAARALVVVGFEPKERVRAALKATFVSRRADLGTFDRLFEAFWRGLLARHGRTGKGGTDGEDPSVEAGETASIGRASDTDVESPPDRRDSIEPAPVPEQSSSDLAGHQSARNRDRDRDRERDAEKEEPFRSARYSRTGRPERLSVSPSLLAEGEALDRPLKRLTRALASIDGRRWVSGGHDSTDVRRALRRSFGTGGTVVSLPRRERRSTDVRATLLVDVSRSVLDTIDRGFLLRFLRAATAQWRATRTFLFDSSVREVSAELGCASPDATLAALRAAETEWGGGTRIAAAIGTIRREAPDAIDRTTTVFVISDGLETGETGALEAQMSWLAKRARLVLWANPLACAPGYEPTARGMAASLPYIDGLFAFGGPEDLTEIARQLETRDRGAIGYAFDSRRRTRE